MNDPTPLNATRRLWGLDVIVAIYAIATLLMVWLMFNGTRDGRLFAIALGIITAIIALGIAFRVNAVRMALMVLLVIALIGDGLLALFYLSALSGMFQSPPNKDPLEQLMRMPVRIGATLTMLMYLRRADVRNAFLGRDRKPLTE